MNVSWRNAVLILAGWTLVNMAWAQTDDARAVLTRLPINQVAELDGMFTHAFRINAGGVHRLWSDC